MKLFVDNISGLAVRSAECDHRSLSLSEVSGDEPRMLPRPFACKQKDQIRSAAKKLFPNVIVLPMITSFNILYIEKLKREYYHVNNMSCI